MNIWRRVFLPYAIGYYLSYLLRNVNAVIAPELSRDLSASAADLGLLTSAYLLAFGAFQLPLGLLLDRYGPRRVETGLLLVAAAGSTAFALGSNLGELAVARAFIGLGVSACLMASFKAFSLWFPLERQASLNAAVMAAGGLGALTATMPIGWALPIAGWRGIFLALALLAVLVATGILSTPERPPGGRSEPWAQQLRALGGIMKSRVFWCYAPQTAVIVGGFMAMQGLWAVPWLMRVNEASRELAAFHLLLTSAAMLAGFVAIATLVVPLQRRGVHPDTLLKVGMGGGLLLTLAIVADIGPTLVLWCAFGLVFSVGNLAYALLSAHFPVQLSGRVNTALNLAAFVGAFGLQWGFGIVVDALQSSGLSARDAFRATYAGLLVLQVLTYLWFLFGAGEGRKPVPTT